MIRSSRTGPARRSWTRLDAGAALLRRLRRLNAPLIAGALMTIVLIICAVWAPALASFDPNTPRFVFDGADMVRVPYPPGTAGMPLGSDSSRRDVWSRLVYGARFTLLFCGVAALLRLALGTAVGMLAGWYRRSARFFDLLIGAWSAIPSLFFAILLIGVVYRRGGLFTNVAVFTSALVLTGWTEAAIRSRTAVQVLATAPFVEAAYAIGLSKWAVLWRHVRPNLRDLLFVEAAYTMAAVLLLVAELGFLNIFVGGGQILTDIDGTVSVLAHQPEWGSLLADGVRWRTSAPVLFLAPMAAFSYTILAFNLLAEGLRRRR